MALSGFLAQLLNGVQYGLLLFLIASGLTLIFGVMGIIMAAAALLAKTARPTEADIEGSITNICRCGTYARIKSAILAAAR